MSMLNNHHCSLTSPTLNRRPDVTLAALFFSFSPLASHSFRIASTFESWPILSLKTVGVPTLGWALMQQEWHEGDVGRPSFFSYQLRTSTYLLRAKVLATLKVPWTATTAAAVSAYLSRYPWRLSTCAMGLLGPSAVEHTTGVVFRVGTPGRLAGRCLWPSLSSRKSKATGVVAVPFSSISPLHHLLRFLPPFYSLPFSFPFFLSRSLHLYLYLVLFLFISVFSYYHMFASWLSSGSHP